MADALGVTVEDLLIIDAEKPLRKKTAKTNSRAVGKVREVFDCVSKLHAVSRSTSSTGFLLTSLITSNPDNENAGVCGFSLSSPTTPEVNINARQW
jgi:hypothetical protein